MSDVEPGKGPRCPECGYCDILSIDEEPAQDERTTLALITKALEDVLNGFSVYTSNDLHSYSNDNMIDIVRCKEIIALLRDTKKQYGWDK